MTEKNKTILITVIKVSAQILIALIGLFGVWLANRAQTHADDSSIKAEITLNQLNQSIIPAIQKDLDETHRLIRRQTENASADRERIARLEGLIMQTHHYLRNEIVKPIRREKPKAKFTPSMRIPTVNLQQSLTP